MSFDPSNDPSKDPSDKIFGSSLKGIFQCIVGGRGPRKPSSQGAGSDADGGPDTEAIPLSDMAAEPPKAKVTLRNPKWEVEDVGFNEETDISIEAELPAEYAHKTRVAFELFAKTPDGPERISKADGQIKDGKAIAKIPVYIPEYRDEDFNLLKAVDYYFTAKHSESDLFKDEKALKTVDHMAETLLEVHVVENVTFATGKSFPRTSQAVDLNSLGQAITDWRGKHPEGKVAVFGHADAVGQEDSNKTLSERRAKAIHAFLVKDPVAWEELYNGEKWGLATTQEVLKHLGHDPGALDGVDGPKTQGAVKDFQGKKGLGTTGTADAKTREALYLAYMESCGSPAGKAKEFDAIDGRPFAGCSEFNLVENIQGASETNRRVAVLLLKSNKNFPVQYPCKHGDIGPCQKQAARKGERKTPGFKCLFYDKLVVEKKGVGVKPAPDQLKLVGVKAGEEVKQYVNLSAAGTDRGKERLLEVEVEDAVDGTKVFWKVTADAGNSKRNSPKPGLMADAKGKLTEFAGSSAELETEVKGGKASCVLACGLAGGDKFTVEVGLEKGKAAGAFTVVNWRKLYYQLTHHKDLTPPSMDTAVKNLKPVFIEWEAEPAHEHDLMGDGKVIVGNHNAAKFHALLKSPKTDQCAHIIFCDKQYDGLRGGKNITLEKNADFKTASGMVTMGEPGNTVEAPNPPVQEGAKLFLSGSWSNAKSGKSGTLTDDPSKVDDNTGLATWLDEVYWQVDLPKNATPADKSVVKVTLKCTAASGPWGGDGGTAPHNLIVIDKDDTIHSMCVMHELGHIMNMTPLAGSYKAPPGLALDHKHAYTGMGGAGSHCSFEIDTAKSTKTRNVDGKCIMFHQLNKNCKLVYCPECARFVKAQALEKFQELEE